MNVQFQNVDGVWYYTDVLGGKCPVNSAVVEEVFNTPANEHYTFVVVSKTSDITGMGPITADLRIELRQGMIQRASVTFDKETPFGGGAEVHAFNYEFNDK